MLTRTPPCMPANDHRIRSGTLSSESTSTRTFQTFDAKPVYRSFSWKVLMTFTPFWTSWLVMAVTHVVRQVEHPQTTCRLPDATDLDLVALDGDGRELKEAVAVCRRTQRDLPLDVPLADAECLDRLTWYSGSEQTVENILTPSLDMQLYLNCTL